MITNESPIGNRTISPLSIELSNSEEKKLENRVIVKERSPLIFLKPELTASMALVVYIIFLTAEEYSKLAKFLFQTAPDIYSKVERKAQMQLKAWSCVNLLKMRAKILIEHIAEKCG